MLIFSAAVFIARYTPEGTSEPSLGGLQHGEATLAAICGSVLEITVDVLNSTTVPVEFPHSDSLQIGWFTFH